MDDNSITPSQNDDESAFDCDLPESKISELEQQIIRAEACLKALKAKALAEDAEAVRKASVEKLKKDLIYQAFQENIATFVELGVDRDSPLGLGVYHRVIHQLKSSRDEALIFLNPLVPHDRLLNILDRLVQAVREGWYDLHGVMDEAALTQKTLTGGRKDTEHSQSRYEG
jgi:hypothetical protein